jgi:hypothetical protein
MNKYTFYVTDIVGSTYEVYAEDEDSARDKLDDILENEDSYFSEDDAGKHEIVGVEILLAEVAPRAVKFDGTSITVETPGGTATMDLTELIEELYAKADGGES